MSARSPLHVVILAAGRGVRMGNGRPKVLVDFCGKPMLAWVLAAVRKLRPARIHVVVGQHAAAVRQALTAPDISWVVQHRPAGTADAAQIGCTKIPATATVLVLFGDLPLVQVANLRRLVTAGRASMLGVRTMHTSTPHGYSRILRNPAGQPLGLVVHSSATAAQRRITEVDAGGMAFPARWGKAALAQIRPSGIQRERPLTDLVACAIADGIKVRTIAVDAIEGLGVNTPGELLLAEAGYSQLQVAQLQRRGVLFADPNSVAIRGELKASAGVFIDRNVLFQGTTSMAAGTAIGPCCVVKDTSLHRNAQLDAFTHADGAVLKEGAQAGPFARLRPGSVLGKGAKVGNFVELKQVTLGPGAKANHLAYLGDGTVGAAANIGAGTVFCNYDGVAKHRTIVGADAFIGSGSMLIAPVVIGAGALVAAGSVISKDVAPGSTAFGRARQISVRTKGRKRKLAKKKSS